jgi:alkylation response protein AidB-like acyl-CoA dehydrogenase
MADYRAPVDDMRFALREVAGLEQLSKLQGFAEADPELIDQVLEEAAKLAGEVLAPLNHIGDRTGAVFENGVVRTPDGFRQAYHTYVEGGWNTLPFDPDYGGQGLPWVVAGAIQEMWHAANTSWALCPLLNQGAVELLTAHGSEWMKQTYLPRMITGEWTGTMNLTEPQAGSDVGAVKTRATPNGDHYLIQGQKIYITYGEHDFADNIVHLVLARTPGAPEGTRGISLFLVPKFLVNEDGSPGPKNDLRCVSIERKLGIHASPTCVMAYGDSGGAIGYLIGEENQGMRQMFTMMNNARLAVGVQGVGIAERAYQQARAYAFDRVQSRDVADPAGTAVAIVRHPDVRRMLLTMKAMTEAARGLSYYALAGLDRANRADDSKEREQQQIDTVELLTPVVKAWATDIGVEVASLGVQVHGGMGFIEETGAAQHLRDARIAPIYEGTNGIQALDLVNRKVVRHRGYPARAFAATVRREVEALEALPGQDLADLRRELLAGAQALEDATDWLVSVWARAPQKAAAGSTPYLRLLGTLGGGWALARQAGAAARQLEGANGATRYLEGKIKTARFYADNVLPQAGAAAVAATRGAETTLELSDEQF